FRHLWRVRCWCAKDDLETAIHEFDCAQQMLDSLLARNPTDKQQTRFIWVDTVSFQRCDGIDLSILFQIDSIVNHVHAGWNHIEEALDVTFGLARNSNNRVRHLQRGLLNPKRKVVTARQLFAFPGSKRLQRMNRDHEWNSVIFFRQDSAEMAVPGVTMHQIGIDVRCIKIRAAPHCAENGTQRFRAGEIARVNFEASDLEIAFLEALIAKTTNFHRYYLRQFA